MSTNSIAVLIAFLALAFFTGYTVRAMLDGVMARQARDARIRLERANASRCPECGQYPPVAKRAP